MTSLDLQISGMSCGHCVSAVKNALQELDGVQVKKVEIGSASVDYDPARSSPSAIENAIEDAGYQVGPASPVQLGRAAPKND
ncbi:MAG TPA: cation transporter [Gemmatimonadaceae bacterium]|nr:cation transporter [Gemmatimonadaceae bacterium]